MSKKNIYKKWLTLIEVLISIIVFGVGILAVSYQMISNITLSEKTKLKTTSTILAKEGMELIYNLKDTHVKKWWFWNCAELDQANYMWLGCKKWFYETWLAQDRTSRKIQVNPDSSYSISPTIDTRNANQLFKKKYEKLGNVFDIYTHIADWEPTYFARWIRFKPVYLEPEWKYADTNEILKVESIVQYKKGKLTWEVVLESFIWDSIKNIDLEDIH